MNDFLIRQVMPDDKETLEKIFKLRVVCRQEQGYITFDKFLRLGSCPHEPFASISLARYKL
jgi:hypothetical protein